MKTTPLFILLLGCLLGCKKDDASPTQAFDLIYQQPTTITAGGSVQVLLTSVNDSRCPSDVVCVTGGTVAATITFAEAGPSQTVRLGYDRYYTRDSSQVTLHSQVYWVRLLNVTPYPSTKNGSQTKTATLRLCPQ